MTENRNQKSILELKKQLSEMPATENFRKKREKLEIKITAYEIMFTPAANNFLNDILEEKKKLLPEQGIFSFAQILTREQFYRNNCLPTEINLSIEKKVWELVWKEWEQMDDNSFVFFLKSWSAKKRNSGGFMMNIFFTEEIQTKLPKPKILAEKKVGGIFLMIETIPEAWQEFLKEYNLETEEFQKTFERKTKVKLILTERGMKKCQLFVKIKLKDKTDPRQLWDFITPVPERFEIIFLTQKEQISAQQTNEILWLLRVLRGDIGLEETAPAGLREQQEFLQNHFKREFEKLHTDNPQLLGRVKDLPWFKFHALYNVGFGNKW